MSGWTLNLKQAPSLRVDARALTPNALAGLAKPDVERLGVGVGHGLVPLAEFFEVRARDDGSLVFVGDLARFDRVGWQMDGGTLVVDGPAGHYAGAGMRSGEVHIKGHAAHLVACEMAGGVLRIDGDVGDFAASTLPGSMDGMRGGLLVVKGNAGARFGDRMRRGTAVVHGSAGSFLASRMVAGTIAIGGAAGAHPGFGMRRGSIVFAGAAPVRAPTFVSAIAAVPVFWQLLARDLAQHGGGFSQLPQRGIERLLGDVAVGGKGELIVVR